MALEVASLFGTLELQDALTPALSSARGALDSFGSQMQTTGRDLRGMGEGMTTFTAPLRAFGEAGLDAASDFESAMAEIQARSGATADDMARVSDFALQMGADTAFSSQQAADSMLELMSSGQSVEEAMRTLPMVMTAAAAGGEDLAATADNLTNIMASFGLEIDRLSPAARAAADNLGITNAELSAFARGGDPGDTIEGISAEFFVLADSLDMTIDELYAYLQAGEDAATVTESLARAAGASSADMASLSEGFANVGPVAAQFGMSVDQTAAALAILAENGIAGAEAGSALKSMLLNMSQDTAATQGAWNELGISLYDAEGNMRNMQSVLFELDTALDALPVEDQNRLMQDLAGSYGIVALAALTGETSIGEMQSAMDDQASAADVAAARMDTFKGRVDSLMGSVESLMITALTPFMENVLTPLAEHVSGLVNQFTAWAEENPELASTIVAIGAALVAAGPVLVIAGTAISAIGTAAGVASGALGVLLSPAVLLVGAFAGIMAAGGTLDDFLADLGEIAGQAGEGLQQIASGDIAGGILTLVNAIGGIPVSLIENLATAVGNLIGVDVAGGIAAWGPALEAIGLTLQITFDNIKQSIERFLQETELSILDRVAQIQQNLGVEIIPEVTVRREALARELTFAGLADDIESMIRQQTAGGALQLDTRIEVGGGTIALTDPTFDVASLAAEMGPAGRMAVQDAINLAITSGDVAAYNALIPLATALDIPVTPLTMDVQDAIDMATDPTFVAQAVADLTVYPGLIDITEIAVQLQNQLNTLAAGVTGGVGSGAGFSVESAAGGAQITREGLLYVHEEEQVLTAAETREYHRGGSGGGNTYIVYSYGSHPHELLEMLQRTQQDRG